MLHSTDGQSESIFEPKIFLVQMRSDVFIKVLIFNYINFEGEHKFRNRVSYFTGSTKILKIKRCMGCVCIKLVQYHAPTLIPEFINR